jgi:hypothetical protein
MNKMSYIAKTQIYDGSTPLKPRIEKFLQLYLKNGNATLSHRLAGFRSVKNNQVCSSKLLSRQSVKKRLEFLQNQLVDKEIWNTKEIIKRIQIEAETATKSFDRTKALELLGKSKAMFTEKVKHSGELKTNTQPVVCVLTETAKKELEKLIG